MLISIFIVKLNRFRNPVFESLMFILFDWINKGNNCQLKIKIF